MQGTTNDIEIIIQHQSLNKAPNYSLRVDGNGDVEYTGIGNVKTLGKHISKISPQDLNRIVRGFTNIYFFSFKDSYQLSSSESSSLEQQGQTSISFRLGAQFKTVKFVEDAYRLPSELKSLVQAVEKITKVNQLSGMDK